MATSSRIVLPLAVVAALTATLAPAAAQPAPADRPPPQAHDPADIAPPRPDTTASNEQAPRTPADHDDDDYTFKYPFKMTQTPEYTSTSGDFASDVFGDPWDYDNPGDLLTDWGPTLNVTNPTVGDGVASFTGLPDLPGYISPLWMTWPGATAGTKRDGTVAPVDTDEYDMAVIWAKSTESIPASVDWFSCQQYDQSCMGGAGFWLQPGWHRYEIPLKATPTEGRTHGWVGDILGIRLAIGGHPNGVNIELDSFMLVKSDRMGVEFRIEGDRGEIEIWPEGRHDRATTIPTQFKADPDTGLEMSAVLQAGSLEPGVYKYRATTGAAVGDTYTLTVDGAEPRILQPDAIGDESRDYATSIGRPWNMDSPAAVLGVHNTANARFEGGALHGTNAPPQQNDPYVLLPVGPAGVDTRLYRNLTIVHDYDGKFELYDGPGGGMHGRLLWKHAGRNTWVDGKEVVHWSDRNTFTVDLHTNGVHDNQEDDNTLRAGWRTGTVTALRYDLNEDRGARSWRLHDIKLTPDDTATSSGRFPVEWVDDTHEDGTTVTLRAGRRPGDPNPVVVAENIDQKPGVNVRTVDLSRVGGGRLWIQIEATRPDGSVSTSWSTGPVAVPRRLAGADRIQTAVEMAQMHGRYDTAVLATATGWADAATGTTLAAAVGGPMLLTGPNALDRRVVDELARARTSTVYLLGGTAALPAGVARQLRDIGVQVKRLAGADRFETAGKIADEAAQVWRAAGHDQAGRRPLVVSGSNFPDALTAGPLAAARRQPILLAGGTTPISPATASRIDGHATIVGGHAAVPVEAADMLTSLGARVDRVAGVDRFETATKVADQVADERGSSRLDVLLATGDGWADALAGGSLAADRDGVVLLTSRQHLPDPTRHWVGRHRPTWLQVAGGPAAVADSTVAWVEDAAGCANGC